MLIPIARSLIQDMKYAVRVFGNDLALTATLIFTLALGIGSCIAVYSLIDAALVRSLPYEDPSSLVYLYTPNRSLSFPPNAFGPSYADFFDLSQQSHAFVGTSLFEQEQFSVTAGGAAVRVGGARVDSEFFTTLQRKPHLGRVIQPEDDQRAHDRVVVIGDVLRHQLFGKDGQVIGKPLTLNRVAFTIIGIMPAGFEFPHNSDFPFSDPEIRATQVWVPLALDSRQKQEREGSNSFAIARLRPGISLEKAQAETSAIMARLDLLHGGRGEWGAYIESFRESTAGPIKSLLILLACSVAAVFAIACSNAASLLLARCATRRHEFSARLCLGARRSRLVGQLLTESLILSVVASAMGVLLAKAIMRAAVALDPFNLLQLHPVALNRALLVFCILLALLSTVMAGLTPALSASRRSPLECMRGQALSGGLSAHNRLRSAVVIFEIALVVILAGTAMLLLRSYINVQAVQPGFASNPISMSIHLDAHYGDASRRAALFHALLDGVRKQPGVSHAAIVNNLPLSNSGTFIPFRVEGFAYKQGQLVGSRFVTPEYFEVMQIPLLAGSMLDDTAPDDASASVIVNRSFTALYLKGQSAVGGHIQMNPPNGPWKAIIGVIGDVRHASLEAMPEPEVYQLLWQNPPEDVYLVLDSRAPAASMAAAVRSVLSSIDQNLTVADVQTLADLESESTAQRRFQTSVISAFAVIALILTGSGIYGLLSYWVRQSTPEIGIRMALGATRGRVINQVLGRALRLVAAGLCLGIGIEAMISRVIANLMFGISATSPSAYLAATVLLAAVGGIASALPARRAAAIDPSRALRNE